MSGVYHGGGLDAAVAKYGGKHAEWLDLSTGINPNAYPTGKITKNVWARLPDSGAEEALLKAARKYYGVRKDTGVIAGNGTQAILEVLPRVLPVKKVEIVSPTYKEHAHIWEKGGIKVKTIDKVVEATKDADLLVVVNPNNPDGRSWQPADLVIAANRVRYMVVDEAFCDAVPANSLVPELPDNALVLRSFGKFFGLAGLRLGFAIGNTEITDSIRDCLGPWAVSGPALHIGATALQDKAWILKVRELLETQANLLSVMLHRQGLEIAGRNALFVYVQHKKAGKIFKHLAANKILVRPFGDMPDRLRFGLCANDKQLKRLEKALSSFG